MTDIDPVGPADQLPSEPGVATGAIRDAEPFFARTKSFIRRSRPLPPGLSRTWQNCGSRYLLPVSRGAGLTTVARDFRINLSEAFGRTAPTILEIGSGSGEQIISAAQRWPERNFLAVEVWTAGIAKTMSKAQAGGINNLRILEADAAQALRFCLDLNALEEVWTFFPDPWRKARHQKRRLVSAQFAQVVANLLVEGGVWRLATDWEDYAWQMRETLEQSEFLVNPYEGQTAADCAEGIENGFAPRWEGRILTRFERRAFEEGRQVRDLTGIKAASPESVSTSR